MFFRSTTLSKYFLWQKGIILAFIEVLLHTFIAYLNIYITFITLHLVLFTKPEFWLLYRNLLTLRLILSLFNFFFLIFRNDLRQYPFLRINSDVSISLKKWNLFICIGKFFIKSLDLHEVIEGNLLEGRYLLFH